MTNQSFFMVFVEGGNNPVCRHATKEIAENEAMRLCRQLHKKAWVLCTIKSFEAPAEFLVKDCRPDNDLPF